MRPVGRPQEHNAFRRQVNIALSNDQYDILYDCYIEHCNNRNINPNSWSVTEFVRCNVIVAFLSNNRPIDYIEMVKKENKHLDVNIRLTKW